MSTLFQITLKDILVIENGQIEDNVDGQNNLVATLYYPREGIPAISSIRPLSLTDNELLDYTKEEFKKQLVFKELIKGDSILEVEISAIEKTSKFEKLLVDLLGFAAKKAVGLIPGIGTLVTSIATSATESIFELSNPKDKISVIGRGMMPINSNTPEGDLAINMSVPKKITLKQRTVDNNGNQILRKKILKAGFVNAKVVFQLKKISNSPQIT